MLRKSVKSQGLYVPAALRVRGNELEILFRIAVSQYEGRMGKKGQNQRRQPFPAGVFFNQREETRMADMLSVKIAYSNGGAAVFYGVQ
jgi:hypothetical protein